MPSLFCSIKHQVPAIFVRVWSIGWTGKPPGFWSFQRTLARIDAWPFSSKEDLSKKNTWQWLMGQWPPMPGWSIIASGGLQPKSVGTLKLTEDSRKRDFVS